MERTKSKRRKFVFFFFGGFVFFSFFFFVVGFVLFSFFFELVNQKKMGDGSSASSSSSLPLPSADLSAKDLFAKLQERYLKLEETTLPTSHPSLQEELVGLVEGFGEVWKRAENESLFSVNEKLKEVETTSLPFVFS